MDPARSPRSPRAARRLALVAACGLLIAACGDDAGTSTPTETAPANSVSTPDGTEAGTAPRTTYPVTITDCDGRTTVYDHAPERVVTIDPSVTELLLTLGLKDRIVGYTEFFAPERQWAETKADMATLTMVNDGANYPSKEAVVALRPDLVTSVYSYAFADPLPDRAGWDALGVDTYQALGSCQDPGALPSDLGVLYDDIRNFGIIFDVQAKAEAEIAELQAKVTDLQTKARDAGLASTRIAPYDGYDEQPTYYGGFENAIISLAGSTYVWAETDPNASPSWEQFVAADPEVIWIVPDAGAEVADLEQRLETDPRFGGVTGIAQQAFVVVAQSDATIESPRLVDGLAAMVDALIDVQGTAPAALRTQYPVTVTDCDGEELVFDAAPQRVVTFDPAVTEILITLGLQDRIVGITLFEDADSLKLWDQTADVMRSLEMINDPTVGYPSKETVIAASPDLVMSEYPSAFDADYGVNTRDGFRDLGIASYLTHGGCGDAPVWSDLSVLYQDIRDFGVIFDVQAAAEAEIASLESAVDALQQKAKDAGVPDYRIGMHCCGMDTVGSLGTTTANAIISLAGSHYAFVDVDGGADPISWEVFIDRDPEVIWTISGLGETSAQIQEQIEADPRLAGVTAVRNHAYVDVPYDDVGESPRVIDGLTALVDGLVALQP